MKRFLCLASVSALLAVRAAAVPLYPNGVVASGDVTLSELEASGWQVEMDSPYGGGAITEAEISSWVTAAGPGGYVFVGGTDLSGDVILGATGLASQVLFNRDELFFLQSILV